MATPKLTPDQIAQVSELVAGYISAQREKYAPRAVPLSAQQRAPLEPFFAREVIDSVRVLVLEGERVPNPEFYPMLRGLGFANLPDQSAMGAITFCDVVVSHEPFSAGLLFHARGAISAIRDSAFFAALCELLSKRRQLRSDSVGSECLFARRTL